MVRQANGVDTGYRLLERTSTLPSTDRTRGGSLAARHPRAGSNVLRYSMVARPAHELGPTARGHGDHACFYHSRAATRAGMALASARPKRNATRSDRGFGKLGPRQRHVARAGINRSDLSIQRRENENGKIVEDGDRGRQGCKRRLRAPGFLFAS